CNWDITRARCIFSTWKWAVRPPNRGASMVRVRWDMQFAIALVCIAFLPWNLHAREEIQFLPLQTVKSLAGVVTVNGDPVPGAHVVECSSDWKVVIRKTSTDAQGRFALATVEGREIYYLQFSALRP